MTIDSDFVLTKAFKQARSQAIEENNNEITLRIFVMKQESEIEHYTCLECQNQYERDISALIDFRRDCEKEYDVYEKELYHRQSYPSTSAGAAQRNKVISDISSYLDKLKYYMSNNYRVCSDCFAAFLHTSNPLDEPSAIQGHGFKYGSSYPQHS